KMSMLALGIYGFAGLASCGDQSDVNTPRTSEESSGAVDFALQLGDGHSISSASYTITGPNGFSKTGTIDVSKSTKLTAIIAGLPAGTGYQISITATTTDGSEACAGSASFDVQAGQTATVTVPLDCHEAPRTGSVMVSGKLNVCPTIDGIGANPA